jgi:hypothetical protein
MAFFVKRPGGDRDPAAAAVSALRFVLEVRDGAVPLQQCQEIVAAARIDVDLVDVADRL